jgi:hypothetical protein
MNEQEIADLVNRLADALESETESLEDMAGACPVSEEDQFLATEAGKYRVLIAESRAAFPRAPKNPSDSP